MGVQGIVQKDSKLGKNLDVGDIDNFKGEQVVQLHELYMAAKGEEKEEESRKD